MDASRSAPYLRVAEPEKPGDPGWDKLTPHEQNVIIDRLNAAIDELPLPQVQAKAAAAPAPAVAPAKSSESSAPPPASHGFLEKLDLQD
jgi:hypothetical protein